MTATLWLCARHELLLAARSRWLHWFAVVFAGLALLVASSGYVLSGGHGLQDFARTAVSLVQLVLLIVPLAALVFGTLTLAPERGAAELLYAQPVPRSSILAGRVLGLFLALAAAQLLGFGLAGLAVQWSAGLYGASQFRARINHANTKKEVEDALEKFFIGASTDLTAPEGEQELDYRTALG